MTSAGEDRLASLLEEQLAPPWVVYRNVAWSRAAWFRSRSDPVVSGGARLDPAKVTVTLIN